MKRVSLHLSYGCPHCARPWRRKEPWMSEPWRRADGPVRFLSNYSGRSSSSLICTRDPHPHIFFPALGPSPKNTSNPN
jgi:hypothetical protein